MLSLSQYNGTLRTSCFITQRLCEPKLFVPAVSGPLVCSSPAFTRPPAPRRAQPAPRLLTLAVFAFLLCHSGRKWPSFSSESWGGVPEHLSPLQEGVLPAFSFSVCTISSLPLYTPLWTILPWCHGHHSPLARTMSAWHESLFLWMFTDFHVKRPQPPLVADSPTSHLLLSLVQVFLLRVLPGPRCSDALVLPHCGGLARNAEAQAPSAAGARACAPVWVPQVALRHSKAWDPSLQWCFRSRRLRLQRRVPSLPRPASGTRASLLPLSGTEGTPGDSPGQPYPPQTLGACLLKGTV